jgi:methylmalonyl-CoA mutase cobalamin-binding subunit
MEGVTPAAHDRSHRVLVISNLGLEHAALCAEVCHRGTQAGTEAMIIAPVVASSRLHKLTDDIGPELGIAQHRLDVALETLKSNGIKATGHAAPGDPMDALLDGLRQFHANEVVMLRGGETGWDEATTFAERVRNEVGLLVTEVDPPAEHLASATTPPADVIHRAGPNAS